MKKQTKATRAEQQLSETKALAADLQTQLNHQTASVDRLTAALTRALGAGQVLAEELDGINASRMIRLRRWLKAESNGVDVTPHFVCTVDPNSVAEMIASGQFDPEWYALQNPDVLVSGVDATYHYFTQGFTENRLPSPQAVDPGEHRSGDGSANSESGAPTPRRFIVHRDGFAAGRRE